MNIPLSQPDITELEIESVVAVLRSTQLSLGPKMEEFERLVSGYVGVPHGIAVSSGTAGLHLCMLALGIGPGDEVILPSFTFIAAANAIGYVGATPVFVDVESETLNLDPQCVKAAITVNTRAIMVVHNFGCPAEMEALTEIARQHGLYLIEDACEAVGATYRGQPAGSFADAATFGFYPNKQITTGEGGMIVTRHASLAREMRAMRNQGRYPGDAWHQHAILGYNYRLSEMSCALGCAQMTRIGLILKKRANAALAYHATLSRIGGLTLPVATTRHGRTSWFVYVIRLSANHKMGARDRVMQSLREDGIQCGRYFAPIHQQPAYAERPCAHVLAVTERESLRVIALPFFSNITQEQIEYVASGLRRALASEDRH